MDSTHAGDELLTDDERSEPEGRMQLMNWPPSPKMQIVLIALAFGLLNVVLLVIWVIALIVSR